jgi:mono/diheme cytochrome c family protein
MKRTISLTALAVAFCGIVLVASGRAFAQEAPAGTADYLAEAGDHWPMLETYCQGCHNANVAAGDLDFAAFSPEAVPENAETWEEAVRKLRGSMMPPPGARRPGQDQVDAFVRWMEGYLDAAASANPSPGRVALHRLNAKEYSNAIQDLLALDLDPAELLPRDDQSDGFDNIANVLQTTPTFFSQFVAAARSVAVQAVGRSDPGAGSQAYIRPADEEGKQSGHVDGLPLGTRGGFAARHFFPADGGYEVNINDLFPGDIYFAGAEHANDLIVLVDDVQIYQTRIGGEEDLLGIDLDQSPAIDAMNARLKNIGFTTTAGPHTVAVTFLARTFAESDQQLSLIAPGGGMDRLMRVTGFEVRGPFNPTGLSQTPSRERIFSCYPQSQGQERACADRILSRIAREAYRRPPTDEDMRVLFEFYDAGRGRGDFDEGIRSALTRILASPFFLYRATEQNPENRVADGIYRLGDLALASRLAFFLWSSVPDDELLSLAEAGRLQDPSVLEAQAWRMLADPKSETLSGNFAYQWLQLGGLDEIDPDPNVFPSAATHRTVVGIDGDLREEMIEEIMLFVDSVIREDRNVVDLLTANYTFLNERLALHYGINSVKGSRFRRVTLDDSVRRGLLGKAGVLMVSSYPDRTSPVRRGAWILENVTGTPPAPPPPDVEALLEDNEVGTRDFKSVRERLSAHRAQPSCNGCHGIMDPLGFALDNFDAVGAWRDVEMFAGTPIDASGELPDGTPLDGPDDLRDALLRKPEQFVQTLTEKLLLYALGRTVEYQDMPAVRAIVRNAADDGYRFSSIITGIVLSDPFRLEEVLESENQAEDEE